MQKVTIICSSNGMSASATLVTKTADMLKVHLPASDSIIIMKFVRNEYVGKAAGLEFTSSGVILKD